MRWQRQGLRPESLRKFPHVTFSFLILILGLYDSQKDELGIQASAKSTGVGDYLLGEARTVKGN